MPLISKEAVDTKEVAPGVFVRILVDKSKGGKGIALVQGRLAPGGMLAWHRHACEEALTVIEGAARSDVGEEIYQLGPGDAVLLPAQVPHQLSNAGAGDLLFVTAFNANEVVRLPV